MDVTGILDKLNSATKYPSIPTYHQMGELGILGDVYVQFPKGPLLITEKVDGTNGRVVVTPTGDWFIGSREELIYARNDRIRNPEMGLVAALAPWAASRSLAPYCGDEATIVTFYFEVFGHKSTNAWKQYAKAGSEPQIRLFDIQRVGTNVLGWSRQEIAGWRERHTTGFLRESELGSIAHGLHTLCTPRLGSVFLDEMPTGVEETQSWLQTFTQSRVADEHGLGRSEGVVIRMADRQRIAKLRFADYNRSVSVRRARRDKEIREGAGVPDDGKA